MRRCRRISVMIALVAALLAFGGLRSGPHAATADAIATTQSCDASGSSGISVLCTIVLNQNIDAGGSWTVTITDPTAGVSACDGSAAGATCTTANNWAEFDCPTGCQQNSTFMITVSASQATAIQESFNVLGPGTSTSAGGSSSSTASTSAGGSGSTASTGTSAGSSTTASTSTGGAGSTTASASTGGNSSSTASAGVTSIYVPTSSMTTMTSYVPAQQVMTNALPPAGSCVGGSIPGPSGCTSLGPGYAPVRAGYGAGYGGYYGGCAGFYGCGASALLAGCYFATCSTSNSCLSGVQCQVTIGTRTCTVIFGILGGC